MMFPDSNGGNEPAAIKALRQQKLGFIKNFAGETVVTGVNSRE